MTWNNKSVAALEEAVTAQLVNRNANPKHHRWTAIPERILGWVSRANDSLHAEH